MKKVTLKDIAKHFGVSISTVSRALSGSSGVSAELREKIVKKARELGYIPNPIAQGLRKGNTRIIGVLIPELSASFFADIVSSIEKSLFHLGYRLILCSTDDDPAKEREHLRLLVNQGVEGILSAPVSVRENKDIYESIIEQLKIPVVFFDRLVESVKSDFVISDNREGIEILVRYLIEHGHRKIGLIHPLRGSFTGEERLNGFLAFRSEIETREEWIKDGKSSERGGYDAFLKIMTCREKPTAVVVGNNMMTLGVLKAAKELNLRIPEDVSLVSFDDAYWNEIFDPPITCVKQDPQQIGLIAATILLDRIKNRKKPSPPMQVVLKVKFVERSSVRTICKH
jgi:LacI family transcriptional regulator